MYSTPDPLLFVDQSRIRHVDPKDPLALFSMWSVFSRASGIMEQGQRLEHMSWRLWAHQSLCERRRRNLHRPTSPRRAESKSREPELSSSVETTRSNDLDEYHVQESLDLEHLVASIKVKQDLDRPLSPLPSTWEAKERHEDTLLVSSASTVASTCSDATQISPSTSSDTSADFEHSVVRGFKPGLSSTYRSQTLLAPPPQPILKASNQKGKTAQFQIGSGESYSSESSATLQDHVSVGSLAPEKSSFRKVTSFKKEVVEIPSKKMFELMSDDDEGAIESDSESETDPSESAIDDDDEEWEDESAESTDEPQQLTFHRVDSRHDLVSRKSAIWDQLHGQTVTGIAPPRSVSAAQLRRSRTSTPVGPSMAASLEKSDSETTSKPMAMAPRSLHPPCPPMSPRATRRNMLTQELGVSLRKHMLNERQQRHFFGAARSAAATTSFNSSGLTRRAQTSVDIRRLATPGQVTTPAVEDYYRDLGIGDYHKAGW